MNISDFAACEEGNTSKAHPIKTTSVQGTEISIPSKVTLCKQGNSYFSPALIIFSLLCPKKAQPPHPITTGRGEHMGLKGGPLELV